MSKKSIFWPIVKITKFLNQSVKFFFYYFTFSVVKNMRNFGWKFQWKRLLVIDIWLKVKVVPDSWKWIRFWKFGPYWVQKYLFHQNMWYQKKPRTKFPRYLLYTTNLHYFFFFFKSKIYWKCEVFWEACIVTFQKSNICPKK